MAALDLRRRPRRRRSPPPRVFGQAGPPGDRPGPPDHPGRDHGRHPPRLDVFAGA
jgi:hypothetical protein